MTAVPRCCRISLSRLFLVTSLVFPLLLVAGCGSTSSAVPPANMVTALAVTPGSVSVAVGKTQQYTATAKYLDGTTADVTGTATWSSAKASVAMVNGSGLSTAIASGSTNVTATLSGISGNATLTVPAAAKTLTSITVTPATTTIAIGGTAQLSASATYSDGSTADVTATATWASAESSVATINSGGLATAVAAGSASITATMAGTAGTATLTVPPPAAPTLTLIAVKPAMASVLVGATQQLTATATYSDGTTGDVTSSVTWSVADPAIATVSAAALATGVAAGSTTATATLDGMTGTVSITVTTPSAGTNISTWHVDTNRSGLNAQETALAPATVTPQSFGKKFSYLVDGYAYAEPLLISNVTIQGAVHDVLYVATEADNVYAFDADNYGTGAPLWKVSLLQGDETPITGASIQPYDGITSTPVIDTQSNTMYVVSTQHSSTTGASFRLNALDIATGAPKFGSPITIQASVPATNSDAVNGIETLTTSCIQRAALLLANGNVYLGFGSCHSGWLLAYDAHSLTQVGVFNASPNLDGEGKYASAGGVWMGGGGPAADAAGNIYITTGNGPWDGTQAFGDSVIRFSPTLQFLDYFTPQDYAYMNCQDSDLAAGGLLLIPGTSQALAGGKMGRLYLVNTANLGHEQANDAGVTQTLFFESDLISPYSNSCQDASGTHTATVNSYEIFGTAAYFNGAVYLGITPTSTSAPAGIRRFTYANGVLTPDAYTSPWVQENTRGTTPFISANGTSNGILWMIDTGQPLQSPNGATTATLRAYDAVNLSNQIYNSSTNSADAPGFGIKFSSPVVANGKVYISTGHDPLSTPNPRGEIDVYGLH